MVFAGEAAWRWKMMMAASDRSYDFFWRQGGAVAVVRQAGSGVGRGSRRA